MKFRNLFIIAEIFICASIAQGQTCSDPVRDYIKRNSDPDTGELFSGESWNGRTGHQPPGGYILKFEAPIGKNGSSVVFICLSVLSEMRSSVWSAYAQVGDRKYIRVSEGVEFGSIPTFYLLTPKNNGVRGLAEIFAGKISFGVISYSLDSSNHLQEGRLVGIPRDQDSEYNDPTLVDKEHKQLEQINNLKDKFDPYIEKILLSEYLLSPATGWRPAIHDLGANGQAADPADSLAISVAKEVTRQRAGNLWKVLK